MKVFSTKYALSKGIEEIEALEITDSGMVVYKPNVDEEHYCFRQYIHEEGRDWHRTREDAESKYREMLHKKLSSLRKSVVKFEKKLAKELVIKV
jgi:hypothetical protein